MFNNKKDPLVDAVKSIMEASAREREIERKLNESLGITSKKALPHELHKEYDEVLKESIAGSQINEVSEKLLKRAKQKAKDKAMVAWELNDKKAEDKNEKRAEKFSAAIAKKQKMKEETKLSPKQEKLAAKAGDKNKIERVDLEALRKDETLDEAKATEAQKEKVAKVMHKWKQGKEHIGKSDKTVPVTKKGQKQAVAIALSQAGLSKKMDESVEAIHEEIRTAIMEKLNHIYENEGVDAANAYFETLSEEERGILGEQTPVKLSGVGGVGGPGRFRVLDNPPATTPSYYQQRVAARAAQAAQATQAAAPAAASSTGILSRLGSAASRALGAASRFAGPVAAAATVLTPGGGKEVTEPRAYQGPKGADKDPYWGGDRAFARKSTQQPAPSTQAAEPKSVTDLGRNIHRELKTPTAPVEPGAGTEFAAPTPAATRSNRAAEMGDDERTKLATPAATPAAAPAAASPKTSTGGDSPQMARPAPTPRPARPAPTSDWKKDVFDSTKIGGA